MIEELFLKYTQSVYIQVIKKTVCHEKDIIQAGMKISTQNYMLGIGSLFPQSCRDQSGYKPKGRMVIGRLKIASHCNYHMLGAHEYAQLSQIYALHVYICWYVLLINKKEMMQYGNLSVKPILAVNFLTSDLFTSF